MFLKNIKLWNFRKFGKSKTFEISQPHLDLNFTKGINVLVGKNDSGKSAIIDAIKIVLKTHSYEWYKIDYNDFYKNSEQLRIEIVFEGLNIEEAKHFTEWLGWKKDEKGNIQNYLRLILDVKRNLVDNRVLPSDIKAGVDPIGSQLNAEAKEYLKVTYLRPLRDAKSELVPKKNSRLTQILQAHDAFKDKDIDHLLVGLFEDFNNSVEKYFLGKDSKDEVLPLEEQKGKELKQNIDQYIKKFYDQSKESSFGVKGNNLKTILEKLELSIKDEINPGLGTLNRLFMASELLHLQKKNWFGLRLGLIEELEAHLHPQAQMQIIESLQEEKDIQLILTTHSPNLGSKIKLKNLILCSNESAFPLGPTYTKLKYEDYSFLERFLDTTKANLFFAKGVIMVEGWSEEIIIPAIAQRLYEQKVIPKSLTEAGVSIVNIGSTAFQRYSKIYLRSNKSKQIDIPVSIITDVDIPAYELRLSNNENGKIIKSYPKKEKSTVKAESKERVLELTNKFNDQNVKAFIADNWTLEYCLYRSDSLSELFIEAFKKVHPKIELENIEDELGKKLINSGLKKTQIAYELAEGIELNDVLPIDENDKHIKYLIDAIKYVCDD